MRSVERDDGARVRNSLLVPPSHGGGASPQKSNNAYHSIGFNQKIISMYARGAAIREIRRYFRFMYGINLSAVHVSGIAKAAMADAAAWKGRPLEPMYPVVFFEELPLKTRDDAQMGRKTAYFAFAVLPNGVRDVLGIWVQKSGRGEDAADMLIELHARGVADILIAVVDGRSALVPAMRSVFAKTFVHSNIFLIRESLEYVNAQERSALATALRPIYTANSAEIGRQKLNDFAYGAWREKYPFVVNLWVQGWESVTPCFALPTEIRRVIYTTSSIDNLCTQLKRAIKARDLFSNGESAVDFLWLALRSATHGMTRSTRDWKAAMRQFAAVYEERFVHVRN